MHTSKPKKISTSERIAAMHDFVTYTHKATNGFAQITQKEVSRVTENLVHAAGLLPNQAESLVNAVNGRVERSKAFFERQVSSAIDHAVKRLDQVSSKELGRLEKRVNQLEKKLNQTL